MTMAMAMPEQAIAVDPNEVTRILRQRHAELLDALTYENATLLAALNDTRATIGELRIKNEELAGENQQLRAQLSAASAPTAEKAARDGSSGPGVNRPST